MPFWAAVQTMATQQDNSAVGDDKLVRRYTSTDPVFRPDPATSTLPLYWFRPPMVLSTSAGMHRFTWDVHYQPLPSGGGRGAGMSLPIAAVGYNTVPAPTTPWVNPGQYTVKLTVNGRTYSQPITVKQDPRVKTPALVIYAPLQQVYGPRLTVLARARQGQRMAGEIRALVTAMNPNLPILAAHTLEERQTGPVVVQLRVAALVSGTVGLVGLLLASIGIYGVTAYAIGQRTREIGIRMTLGAQRAEVGWLVLRQGMSLVGIGAAIGLLLASAAGRVLARLLFGLPPLDPVTFGGATLLFAAVGLAACYVPIRRATRISPMEALRYE